MSLNKVDNQFSPDSKTTSTLALQKTQELGSSVSEIVDFAGENITKYGLNADAFQAAIDNTDPYGTLNLPKDTVIRCNKTVNVNKPIVIRAMGAKLIAEHNSQNILVISSDNVLINDLNIEGNDVNENSIQIKKGADNVEINNISTMRTLNGISSEDRAKNINIRRNKISAIKQGIILRLPEESEISRNIINDIDVNGGTAIKVVGKEKTLESVTVSTQTFRLTDHGFLTGDKIRFYGSGNLPSGITKDTSYYILSEGLTQNVFKIGLPTGEIVDSSVSRQSFIPVSFTGADIASPTNITVIHTARNIVIKQNKLKNNRAGIYVLGTDDSSIHDNRVWDGTCIQLENSWDNSVTENKVYDAIDLGINLHKNSSHNIVNANHAINCMNAGIGLTIDVLVGIANNNNNVVTNNISKGSKILPAYPLITGNGIDLNGINNENVISGNRLSDNQINGISIASGGEGNVVTANLIKRNKVGVAVNNDGCTVSSNIINANVGAGIALGSTASFCTLTSNRLKGNGGKGIQLGANSQFCTVTGNTADSNVLGNFQNSNLNNNRVEGNTGIPDHVSSDSLTRPTAVAFLFVGMPWFDTTLGKIIYCKQPVSPIVWVDATGVKVWSPNYAYTLNEVINTGTNQYKCTVAGTSGTTVPSHTTGTANDGTVTWEFVKKIN